jgi:quercetin dioxygenase-like cupin family protein
MLIQILSTDFHFEDERGTLTQLVHEGYKQVNVISTRKGVQRGGHYHRHNREAFYVVEGQVELTARKDGNSESRVFGPGDFFGIGPDVSHDFSFIEDTVLVSMYDRGVELPDGTKDIIID